MSSRALVRSMTTRTFVLLLLCALPATSSFADASLQGGVVPAGSGGAVAPGVDHQRHAIPAGAIGLRFPAASIQPETAGYATLAGMPCPEGLACPEVAPEPCLAVYAAAGSVAVAYAFAWAFEPGGDVVPFGRLPVLARSTPELQCELVPLVRPASV